GGQALARDAALEVAREDEAAAAGRAVLLQDGDAYAVFLGQGQGRRGPALVLGRDVAADLRAVIGHHPARDIASPWPRHRQAARGLGTDRHQAPFVAPRRKARLGARDVARVIAHALAEQTRTHQDFLRHSYPSI